VIGAGLRGIRRAILLAAGLLLASAPAAPAAEFACEDCHEVDAKPLAEGPHGFLACSDCHAGADEVPHPEGVGKPDCALCHSDVFQEVADGVHADGRAANALQAKDCEACHGAIHSLVGHDSPQSAVHITRQANTCGGCHANPAMASRFRLGVVLPVEAYAKSVHARAVLQGKHAPSCATCHGAHEILPASDPRSTVYFLRVADTCGTCHADIAKAYRDSVHGQAMVRGVREAPTCTDCHGEHHILSPNEPGSPVYATSIPRLTCGRCHNDLRLAQKYGMGTERVPAFQDSFHGLALRAGVTTVANCSSCHGVHDILPSSDPRSSVNADHLPQTCGKCHPGAGERFPIGRVHVFPGDSEHVAVRVARLAYLWLIALTVGGMLLHNGLDFARKLRSSPLPPPPQPTEGAERLSRGFRIAHGALFGSFTILVYTGFALKFPEGWWARPLLMWENHLSVRGTLHRAAALLLLGTLAFHVAHLVVDRGARACIAAMRPTREDFRELVERIQWMLGRRSEPPRSGALGYAEKLEYLALMWGIGIMSVTGFALWFNDLVLRWLPKWVTDLATVIHYYEAVLATLAILVWHFYFVIFDPVVYPMDKAWLTGRSHPGRAQERKPRESAARSEPKASEGGPPQD
jgi:cytochrome b subunit of formate dehydrogenase